jgi:hypothetical protein
MRALEAWPPEETLWRPLILTKLDIAIPEFNIVRVPLVTTREETDEPLTVVF